MMPKAGSLRQPIRIWKVAQDLIHGTLTQYNADGQVTETYQVVGMAIELTGSDGDIQATLTNSGTPVTTTTMSYDGAGRECSSQDENGLQTQTIYDNCGRVIRTQEQTGVDQNNQPIFLDTDTVYDDKGRVWLTTDAYVDGSSDPIYATKTVYDDLGREVSQHPLERRADQHHGRGDGFDQFGNPVVGNPNRLR